MTPRGIAEHSIPPGFAAPAPAPCRWLISLDYDGTLRAENGAPIPPAFFEQMEAWRPFGVRWGINTGRALDYLLQDILPCSPVLPDFICTCERYVYMADESGVLQPAERHNRECRQINLKLRENLVPRLHAALQQIRHSHPALRWELAAADPLSIEAADSDTMDTLMPLLWPLACPGSTIQRAGRYLRFSDARFTKGTALDYVIRRWQVPQEHLFIMGDGHNDLDAFRMFPHAFCAVPANAHPEILDWMQRNKAGHISPGTGVLQALRFWFRSRVCVQ
ncbi:MAG: HAD hydrolase family protein [Akkermansia sp.]|nr:HAD hydrolase family protein [Akkermansia sp.]